MLRALDKKYHKIWVTRPVLDAHNQIKVLAQLGINSFRQPLLQVAFTDTPLRIDPHTCQAVVFTSANGVRAYVKNNGTLHIPVYAVGDVTCESARENGFTTVYTAQGDVLSLADMIKQKLSPQDGYIYHPASTVVARDLGTLLSDYGYTVQREKVYTVTPCTHLPAVVRYEINDGIIGGVVLMSPRTAGIFVRMVAKYDLNIKNMHIFALSKAVADKLDNSSQHIHIAHYPNFTQLLRHIKREYNIHDEYR